MDPVSSYLGACLGFHDIGPGCIALTNDLGGIPRLSHGVSYVDRLVFVYLREFLGMSVVIMALLDLSLLEPVSEILLVS